MTGNAVDWFVHRHIREGRGESIAFREAWSDGRTLTYNALAEGSARVAGAFQRAGIRREDRAALFVLDQIEFPLAFWGALTCGVVPIPLNTLLATDVYAQMLADSRATIAIVSEELWDVVAPALEKSADLQRVVIIGSSLAEDAKTWDSFIEGADAVNPVECSEDEVAFWLYSSGSTGVPKGVRHVHGSLKVTCDAYARDVLGLVESDTVYSAAKLFFAYGLGNGLSFPQSVGATSLLFKGRPTPESVSSILAQFHPTVFCGVPTLYAAMLQSWDQGNTVPDAPLRLCVSAGEALPAEIGKSWCNRWGVDIIDGVGSTEMLHIFLSNRPGDIEYGTSGTAVPGYEVRLVDNSGSDVVTGEIGELLVRGNSAAADYWNQRQKSRTTFEGEWTRTGDKYHQTDSGRFVYCGRTDDMFKVSGIWVSPFEVEQALVERPTILEAAVVAYRDADGLEKPKAYIVLKDPDVKEEPEAIKSFVKERIGKWKYPREIEIVDALPKTATGKVQRFKLREMV